MSEARIEARGVAKRFGSTIAVFPTDLAVGEGEFVVILGPSGCGKTTTLRMLAGLERPTQGGVFMSGRDVTLERPGARDVACVFQMFSLYPHLSVEENVAFPLYAQGLPAPEAERRATDILRRLGLQDLAKAMPRRLSGGDRQIAGLARALVRTPQAFLMDEPLGSLDAGLRESLRETLRAIHNQAGSTTVLVTHDQAEAMALADRIVVMRDGRVLQIDHPRVVYDFPADLFVADFVGSPGMNILKGRRRGGAVGLAGLGLQAYLGEEGVPGDAASEDKDCYLGVRPENVLLTETGAPCVVEHMEILGSHNLLAMRAGPEFLKAWVPAGVRFQEGETVRVTFLPSGCRWFDGETGRALPWKASEVACLPTW